MLDWGSTLSSLSLNRNMRSRSINAENPAGEKGRGGTAASRLGPSRKGSPCLHNIQPGEKRNIAEIEGPGLISHIWMTVPYKTSEADVYVLRDLLSSAVQSKNLSILFRCSVKTSPILYVNCSLSYPGYSDR